MMRSIKADWSKEIETDVLVLGYGCAGSIAAITAYDKGSKVLILEKMARGGGATFLSNGGIWVPTSMEFAQYLYDISAGTTPMDLLETFVEEAMKIEDYIANVLNGVFERWVSQEIAASFPPLTRPSWPKVPTGKNMIRGHIKAYEPNELGGDASFAEKVRAIGRAYGPDLWRLVKENVEKRGIEVMLETSAKDLVQNEAGEVIGVIAESKGQKIMVNAKKAVVMATGGFGANQALLKAYYPCPFYYNGGSYAQGDGLIMAQKVGAQMWHMLGICGQLNFKAPEYDAAFQIRNPSKHFITVDRTGRRFEDETNTKVHNAWRIVSIYDPEELWYPRIPTYLIFDEATKAIAPMSRDWRPQNDYFWSLDNSAEVEKGWIKKGETLEELAQQIDMDGAVLAQTVTHYNESCAAGSDSEFGRNPDFMGPINTPPYYALPLWPSAISTSGGPRHDKKSRVLDNDDKPIPRLYAAGELGSFIGMLYEAGSGFAECLVFGKIAGENAADETPLGNGK